MQQSCSQCQASFEITNDDLAALAKLAPMIAGKSHAIPPPTLCPPCRQQRRYAGRNDRHYYQGTCDICKKSLITSYSPDKKIPVLCDACYWGDGWDPLSCGASFDFTKPFMEQFGTLRDDVPRLAIYHTQSENAEYTIHSSRNRNCYMASSLVDDEDVHYSDFTFESRSSMELFSCNKVELCYECVFCDDCCGCEFCTLCTNTSESLRCFDCKGSSMLVGCVGQRNKKIMILNAAATEDACKQAMISYKTDPAFRAQFDEQFAALKLKHPHRDAWTVSTENCTGNYLWNCRNAEHCFNARRLEDVRYAYESHAHADTMDCCRIANGELLYDCSSIVDLKNSAFCNLTYQCDRLLYCDHCNGTSECFGCIGLKKHRYCILNKQYSKEEYEALVPKIIEHMRSSGEWGEFFSPRISPFGYNETKAFEWYPLEKADALARGWKWSTYEQQPPKDVKTITPEQLPPDIAQIPDDILQWAVTCEVTGRPFRIVKQELAFYRDRGLPIPRRSPIQRHFDRIRPHNVHTLYDRTCGKCGKAIQTTYALEKPEIVYCERCYLAEVY